LRVAERVRGAMPEELPLFARISATDWAEGGWDVEQSVELAKWLKEAGVDLIDASSGGTLPRVRIPVGPGYQVPFARRIRHEAGIRTGAVGMITEPRQAEEILRNGDADLIFLARELLRNPYWVQKAQRELGEPVALPVQYERAR
ncbi:MAG: oxidoreductase, partial [Thermoanaerobaculia bacterium]